MNTYKKIRGLLAEALHTEGKTGGEQAGRANLSRIPQTRATRTQARGLGAGPHDAPDAGEGSPEDVKQHQQQTQRSRVSGMPSAQKLSLLRIAAKTATGIKLSRIQRMIRSLEGEGNGEKTKSASVTERVMTPSIDGYSRLYEMLLGEAKGMQSRDFPGHEKRMQGHIKRIQNDPRFKVDAEAKKRGATSADKRNEK